MGSQPLRPGMGPGMGPDGEELGEQAEEELNKNKGDERCMLRGLVALRRLEDYGPYEDLALAPASSDREGVRAIAAATTGGRVAAGDAAGRVCVWFVAHSNPPDVRPLFAL